MATGNKVKEHQKNNNKIKYINNGTLRKKEFKARNSLLTNLYEIDHFKSIRNCVIAVMIITVMNLMICDALESGSLLFGFRYILIGFGQFDKVLKIWPVMFLCTILVHPVFSSWANFRMKLNPQSLLAKLWDRFWLTTFLIYITIFLYLPAYLKIYDLPIASTAVVLAEQIRFLMKIHAFVRSNVPRVRSFKQHSEEDYPVPAMSKYFYYLFAPTFVYRDEYPRTNEIRWSFVATNFLEVACEIVFFNFLATNYFVPDFKNFGLKPQNWRTFAVSIFRMILPSSLFLLTLFYLLLHSWVNAWAEMIKFADRLFYEDWWNTTSYTAYYRKWNIVIHDYLHTYIYRDIYEIVLPGNRIFAACAVFLTSAIVHEYIIGFVLGFFFPVLFVEFTTFGVLVTFIKLKDKQFIGNIFLWWSLSVGLGIQFSLYAMEYYSRINCPKEIHSFNDYFVPRMFSCYKV